MGKIKHIGQRLTALFLFVVMLASVAMQPASVYAAESLIKQHEIKNGKVKPLDQPTTTDEHTFTYPKGMSATISPQAAAVDAAAPTKATASVVDKLGKLGGAPVTEPARGSSTLPKITPKELKERRTAKTSVSINSDGSLTQKNYFHPQFFQKDSIWQNIDTTLVEDKNAGDAGTIFGKALGEVESWLSSATNFTIKDNDWQARFSPSESAVGMVRIKKGNSQIGYVPVGAKDVAPVVTTDKDGKQTVHYYDLWPGVNVEYIVTTDAVKENIVIKNKQATNSVAFKVIGGTLKQQEDGSFAIKGALGDEFAVAQPNLMLNNFGMETKGVLKQVYKNNQLQVSVDTDYLQQLPDSSFPAVIDPSTFYSNFGTRAGGNYVSLKSDGYVCQSTVCNPYAGALYDSNNVLRYWRSAVYANYDQFRNPAQVLTNATLHLLQRTNAGFWTGSYDTHTYYVGHATCLNNFGCLEGNAFNAAGTVSTAGDINVTNIYQAMISRGDYGAWLMLGGEDGTNSSYKNFDPGVGDTTGSYVAFTFGGPPASPSMAAPVENQVYIDRQPSLSVNPVSNPNGSNPLQYEMLVSSGAGAVGSVISSGLQSSTQWTVPDGILQDGFTYYVQARSFDSVTGAGSSWGTSVPFRIDTRTGKDASQTYDTLGPVAVDLATGNLTTGASSHASSALGGSLGVSMSYNSPLRSRNGLVGQYWSNDSYTGDPAVTRVDQNVNFAWDTGSPSSGSVPTDYFAARWQGYFVAPQTGSYQFGADGDDYCRVWVNSTLVLDSWSSCASAYGTSISLTAGQVVPIKVDFKEAAGIAKVGLKVKGVVNTDGMTVPTDWLQTGVRPAGDQRGLTGSYYANADATNTFSASNKLFMKRVDPFLSFNWSTGAPVAGGASDFLVRWTGYVTAPTTGNYTFGVRSDDGAKITVGPTDTVVLNDWTNHAAPVTPAWGNAYSMMQNTPVRITIEYYDQGGDANFQFWMKDSAGKEQIVPSSWLSPDTQVLPDGWSLGIGAGGNYDHMMASQSSAILTDGSGTTHEYKWNGASYAPPANEDGVLLRNADGTFTLQDSDGQTYVFNTDGTISSATSAVDDRQPMALQYEYQTPTNGGSPRLFKIKDGIDTSRNATLYYSGSTNCAASPSGFDATTPTGMLCAVITDDGRTTNFFYSSGQLARIKQPGNALTDYKYEQVNSASGGLVGYRLGATRDSVALDAIAAGKRTDDNNVNTQIAYDVLGRVTTVTQPAPITGAARVQHTIEYLPGIKSYLDATGTVVPGYAGMTKQHVVGMAEPNGFTQRVKYDELYRTIEATDAANLSTATEWDAQKDIVYSVTGATGLKSTTVYDDEDRPVKSYGPAPKEWFDTTNPKAQVPLSTYASQIPRKDTAYDQGMTGLSVAYAAANTPQWQSGTPPTGTTISLTGAPLLHATNIASDGTMSKNFGTTSPVSGYTGKWGMRMSGKMRLPQTGTYAFRINSDGGVRMWIDDQLVIDDWADADIRNHTTGTFLETTANKPHRIEIDYFRSGKTTGNSVFNFYMTPPAGSETSQTATYFSPDYSLPTSSKVYDSTLGDATLSTNYGASPELGLAQSTTVTSGSASLTSNAAYEQQAASGGFLRQTNKVTAGNTTTNPTQTYTYYNATETRDNPCTTGTTEAYRQGGMLKTVTDASPNGGATLGTKAETVYDDAGRIVATRTNTESWTCTTYDSRGRVSIVTTPAFNGESARTVNNDYAVGGDPLETTTWDDDGWIVKWFDILGRVTKYRDTLDNETLTTYDTYGRVTQRSSQIGNETYEYDNLSRLTNQKLDGTTYATVVYDAYSRVDHIDYPAAGQMRGTPGRDGMQRQNSVTYRMGDGTTTVSDTATLTQSGRVLNDVVASGSNNLWATYGYDGLGRLASANIGANTFAYGYGTQSSTCGTGTNMNSNAGKNGNRTSQTVNGVTSTYCYDYADRLVSSSDATANYTEYDAHGNMTYIGTGTKPLRMCYDASDRNYCTVAYDSSGTGTGTYYGRDAQGRLTYREHQNISSWTWTMDQQNWYGYTGDGDGPSFTFDAAWNIVEKQITLAGGLLMTIRPQQTGNANKTYSAPSALGRTLLTTNAAGTNISNGNGPLNTFTYDPYGNILTGSNFPGNVLGGSYGFGGTLQKITETSVAMTPIQMGARLYLPTIGRFTSADPIPGGNANAYVYALDPINFNDYSGLCLQACGNSTSKLQPAISIAIIQPAATAKSIAAAKSTTKIVITVRAVTTKIVLTPVIRAEAKPRDNSTALPTAQLLPFPTIGSIMPALPTAPSSYGGNKQSDNFYWIDAVDTSASYYNAGFFYGASFGCLVGAIAAAPMGASAAGCAMSGASYAPVAAAAFAFWGFLAGGTASSTKDAFDGWPDVVLPFAD